MILKPLFYTNQKFWAKFAIVVLLTINGINIHNRMMPILRAQAGRRLFDGLPNGTKIALCATGAISAVSWLFPILLGSAKELSYVASFVELMALYLVALLAVAALAVGFATKLVPMLETWQFGGATVQSGMPAPAGTRSSRETLGPLRLRQRRTDANTDDTSAFLADTLREVRSLAGASSTQRLAYIPRRQAAFRRA
ncbi:MAG: hypothetical protein HC841_01130 [Verrucomicrobiae bacterium]|nr:hypothetical protein [Verrucomicrobiae bacterium]